MVQALTWKQAVAIFLLSIAGLYLIEIGLFHASDLGYGIVYFFMYYGLKVLPLFFVGFLFLTDFKIPRLDSILRQVGLFIFIAASLVLLVFLLGFLGGLPLETFLTDSYPWSYAAVLEWCFCFVAIWFLTFEQVGEAFAASTFALLAVWAGGDLHELPFGFFNVNMYVHISYPLILSTQLVCVFFMALLMYEYGWKPKRLFLISLVVYVVFTIVYVTVVNPNVVGIWHIPDMWLQRLPTIFLLVTIPLGFKNKEVKI